MMMEDIGMNNILLLEDDKSLNRGISFKLKEGYNVFSAFGIEEAKYFRKRRDMLNYFRYRST